MRARKCDRCKKLYEHYKGKTNMLANGFMLIDRNLENKYHAREIIDLCPDCLKDFEAFLKKGA